MVVKTRELVNQWTSEVLVGISQNSEKKMFSQFEKRMVSLVRQSSKSYCI